MSTPSRDEPRSRLTMLAAEVGVALLFAVVGALVVADSLRIGAGWADDGPQAGYFPFYVGSLLIVASLVTLVKAARYEAAWGRAFAARAQMQQVMAVLRPTILYVAGLFTAGIYVSSALFIAWFMWRHGRFRWWLTLPVSVGVPLAVFVIFERWFLVALPKGPLEQAFGL